MLLGQQVSEAQTLHQQKHYSTSSRGWACFPGGGVGGALGSLGNPSACTCHTSAMPVQQARTAISADALHPDMAWHSTA